MSIPPREEIEWLIHGYAEAVDDGDFDRVGALFAAGTYRAQLGDQVFTHTGAEETAAIMRASVILYDGIPGTKHVITNVVVDADDVTGEATARSYFTVLQARPDFPLQVVAAGRYHDTFARSGHTWHFTDRLILFDLQGDLSHHLRQG